MVKKRYRIKIEYETEISAEGEEEALSDFWEGQYYPQHDFDTFIDENTTIEEMDELQSVVSEKIEKTREMDK